MATAAHSSRGLRGAPASGNSLVGVRGGPCDSTAGLAGLSWPYGGEDNGWVRLTIVGFGLIGGSVARALRAHAGGGEWRITAWSRRPAPLLRAVREGVLDEATPTLEDALRGAELVVLAVPPLATLELLERLGGSLRRLVLESATITDVASTKARIVATADRLRLPFVGGHPMAGREQTGYDASLPDLFVGRPWIVVPGRCARLVDGERVRELVEGCGGVQVSLPAAEHDDAVAAISHLPLVLSAALVETIVGRQAEPERPDWLAASGLAATGWAGMTRLARGDAAMGAGITATNAAAISRRLRDLRGVVDEWLAELERPGGPDAATLQARFEAARERLEGRVP